jgi:CBS domain containing-hemolysin-like protein
MSDPEGRTSPGGEGRRRRRPPGWRGALIRWLDQEEPAAEGVASGAAAAPGEAEPVDLVDQAEAFATLRVSDVMTPRADVVALEVSTPLDEVVRRFVEVELTRLPVYRETLDDPLGVVHVKDVMKLLAPPEAGGADAAPPWREAVLDRLRRDALYVPASMRTADLLLRMRAARIHMALVIDEFGGTDGLVTMEDLVEAVVGDIDDEHDEEAAPEIIARPGGLYEVDARAPLEDLEALLGGGELTPGDEDEEEAETVGGLLAGLAGRVPQRGEVILHPDGAWEFEVMDADPRRIRRVRVRPAAPAPAGLDPPAATAVDGAT